MRRLVKAAFAAALVTAAVPTEAKPLSYVGGTMVMQENDETGYTLSVDYTFSPRYAVAFFAKKEQGDSTNMTTVGPQFNTLIKRWNLPDGQGNVFNMTGAGISSMKGDVRPSAWTGFLADYETRHVFTSYELKLMATEDTGGSIWQRARVGVAPYIANYDGIHTWLMVQVDDHPSKDDALVVTPLVRLFYHTTLVEAGYGSNHHAMVNWTLQF